jgi:hypothetical protein
MRAKRISYAELEAVFPWVRFLPGPAQTEFLGIVNDYCRAAGIYSRKAS